MSSHSATFVNQSSNLSALTSSLCSYARLLDVPTNSKDSGDDDVEDRVNAEEFLAVQGRRVAAVDDRLLQATEDILPPSPEMKTMTELAELCRLVQESTRQKMSLLKTRMELLGVPTWNDTITSPMATSGAATAGHASSANTINGPIQWSVGGPLDCVVEGDVETEGATTPGSMLNPSPFASATKPRRTLTPTTPTLAKFSFSASTNSILEKMNLTEQSPANRHRSGHRTPMSAKSPAHAKAVEQLNFDGFQEEDSMITLATVDSKAKASRDSEESPSFKFKEGRSQFLARMESLLERVDEELNIDDRPSDETSLRSKTSDTTTRPAHRPSNNKFLEELKEETEHDESQVYEDDDSTNVVATQVASVGRVEDSSKALESKYQEPVAFSKSNDHVDRDITRPVPVFHRPTQIVVDTGMPSPAHTNLTMDATMMNDTMITMSMLNDDDDNHSTVTPILDRYRLDPDDNSIGIKVVPNQRGMHIGNSFDPILPESRIEVSTPSAMEFIEDNDGFRSPRNLPGSVNERKKKQYRKTPFPKKKLSELSQEENDEENGHPNTKLIFEDNDSASVESNTNSSFTVPPLRPRSLGPVRKPPATTTKPTARALSLPAKPTLPRTPPVPASSLSNDESFEPCLEKITRAEYNTAPRVVQMQVSRDEANQVLDVLEGMLMQHRHEDDKLEFSESDAYQALKEVLPSEPRAKAILVSLCHWKRLLMYRNDQGMTFAVNQFAQ